MGTTCTTKPKGEPILEFFIRQGVLRWADDLPNTYRVLDSALVRLREFYAAVEVVNKETGKREVWAAVIKVTMGRSKWDDSNFCWKDMDETMEPFFYNGPERILDLLTPTDNAGALKWRAKCREVIATKKARPKLAPGLVVNYGGNRYNVLETLGKGYFRVEDIASGCVYRMKPGQARQATIEG